MFRDQIVGLDFSATGFQEQCVEQSVIMYVCESVCNGF